MLVGSDGMFSPDFIKAAGPAPIGMYLRSDCAVRRRWLPGIPDEVRGGNGEAPPQAFHAHAYDATNILLRRSRRSPSRATMARSTSPKGALRDAIYATTDFEGLTGNAQLRAVR